MLNAWVGGRARKLWAPEKWSLAVPGLERRRTDADCSVRVYAETLPA